MQLFLLRDLLGRLLHGFFLRCFFGCHLPILPFDKFCNIPAIVIAVEECIDSRITSVKRKTTQWWKNRQQFFRVPISVSPDITSDHAIRPGRVSAKPAIESCPACANMPAQKERRSTCVARVLCQGTTLVVPKQPTETSGL
jgi:hypothetical protein